MRVFVSAVSKEFGIYRAPIGQGISGLKVDAFIQEEMGAVSDKLILRLDAYVQQSDLIVHMVGDRAGAVAGPKQIELILEAHPGLRDFLGPVLESGNITFTQWEAYLALFHDKQILVTQPNPDAKDEYDIKRDPRHETTEYNFGQEAERASQQAHLARLDTMFEVFPAFTFEDVKDFKIGLYESEEWRALLGEETIQIEPDLSKLPETFADELIGRRQEFAKLRRYWKDSRVNIVALDAMGGAGKTALTEKFTYGLINGSKEIAKAGDIDAAYAWSFYSQGSNEDRQTSAEEFFAGAYKYFDIGEVPKEAGQKAEPLVKAIRQQKTLLILDGLEPLQYAAGGKSGGGKTDTGRVGGIKDPDIERLLDLLSFRNKGLVIATTRIALSRLDQKTTVKREQLQPLNMMDGIKLLRKLGVEPGHKDKPLPHRAAFPAAIAEGLPEDYKPEPASGETVPYSVARDLAKAVEKLRGHALALTLAGRFLDSAHGGDIQHMDMLPSVAELGRALGNLEGYSDDDRDYRDTFRVMHAIEIAAVRSINQRKATHDPAAAAAGVELALLFFLGLFDRPADAALLDVVYQADGALEPDPADLQRGATPLVEDYQQASPTERRERAELWSSMQSADTRIFGAAKDAGAPQDGERELTEQEADDIREARRRVLLRRLFAGFSAPDAKGARKVSIDRMRQALGKLQRRGLIDKIRHEDEQSAAWENNAIDCHPLVREYFGLRLKQLDPPAYRAAHSRLYDHLRFKGLPKAFQEPVAYGVLALGSAFPDAPFRKDVLEHARGELPKNVFTNWPKSLHQASSLSLTTAAALIDGPNWETARMAFLPEDEVRMEPVFAAIRHGCEAEREIECWSEVYRPRVARGNESFASKKLGLQGQELAALANFFAQPFDTPSPRLSEADRASVLAHTAFCLRAVGRLEDAITPYHAVIRTRIDLEDWNNASTNNGTLSELLLAFGRVAEARTAAEEALAHAGRITHRDRALFRHVVSQVRLLAATQAGGDLPTAEAGQLAAEAIQTERQPSLPRLYSISGFLTANLLRTRGRTAEAAERAVWSLEQYRRAGEDWLLDIGLDKTTSVHGVLAAEVGTVDRGPLDAPNSMLAKNAEAALTALRRASSDDDTPRGLLTAAEVRWRVGDSEGAEELVRECEDRVVRGPMPLFHAGLHLLRARMALNAELKARARTYRNRAAELIEKHGYGGARPELTVLTAEIDPTGDNINAAAKAIRGDESIPQDEEHGFGDGWWGLLPRFRALVEHRPAFADTLTALEEAAARYNAARDAWLERTGGIPQPPKKAEDISDDDIAQALTNPTQRAELTALFAEHNISAPLEALPTEALKAALADLHNLKTQPQPKTDKPQSMPVSPDQISDEMLDQALADEGARESLSRFLKANNIEQPLDQVPRETLKAAFAALASAAQRQQQQEQQHPQIPDELIAHIFADPKADELLRHVMKQNNLEGEPKNLPDEMKRQIVELLVKEGAISFGGGEEDQASS